MKRKKSILHQRAGFTLIEIIIGLGMMSFITLGVMQMTKTSTKSQKRSEASMETQTLLHAINQTLLNKESCVNTLSPITLANNSQLNEIKNRVNDVIFNTTATYGDNTIKINRMWLDNLALTGSYGEVTLKVELERISGILKNDGNRIVTRDIPLRVETSGSNVVGCYSSTENAIDTSKQVACASIGGTLINGTTCELAPYPQSEANHLAVSTAYLKAFTDNLPFVRRAGDTMTGALNVGARVTANQFCVGSNCRNFAQQSCAPGQMVERVNADGTLVCKGISCPANRYFEGFNATGTPICKALPTGQCASNQYVKQINANGSVECANVPYHWGVTCSAGQYIERIASNGTPTCKNIIDKNVYGKSCSSGQSLRGFDSSGNPICEAFSMGAECSYKRGKTTYKVQHAEVYTDSYGCSCGGYSSKQCYNGVINVIASNCSDNGCGGM